MNLLSDLNPALTYDINRYASIRLAGAAKVAGVRRFLFSSSCSVHGSGGDELLGEGAAFSPVTPYGKSKVRVITAENFAGPGYFRLRTIEGLLDRHELDRELPLTRTASR
jgi:nucleoside-diphosphate-sugar epimerase